MHIIINEQKIDLFRVKYVKSERYAANINYP